MKSLCLLAAGLAAAVFTAGAQTNLPASKSLSLENCIQSALAHNFDVQYERYQPQISLYNLRSAYAGYDPTFNISGQHNYNVNGGGLNQNYTLIPPSSEDVNSFKSDLGGSLPWGLQYDFQGNIDEDYGGTPNNGFDHSGGSIGVNLTQPLLKNFWVDGTRLAVRVAKNRLKYSEQGLRQQLITTISAVANAYYELIFAQENVEVQKQAQELAQTQLDQDKERVQVGSLAPLDVQQDESQAAQSRANLISAEYTLATDRGALVVLITDAYSKWYDFDIKTAELTAVPQYLDVQESWRKGLTQRPDLLQVKLDVEQQGIQLKYDQNQIYPQLDLIGSYGFSGSSREFSGTFNEIGQGNLPNYSYGAQLSMPLSNAKARNTYKSDKVTEQQLLLKLKQLEQNVMLQINDGVIQVRSAWESVDATKEARIYAEAALDAEQKKYAVGKSTTFTVLQLQNSLTSARSQEIRSLANYNEAIANLDQQEGSTLVRHNIDLEGK